MLKDFSVTHYANMMCGHAMIVKEKRRRSKSLPPNTSWLGVLEDRLPASEDDVDRWTASTTGSVRKGFEIGRESSTASAAEVKGSEWAEGE